MSLPFGSVTLTSRRLCSRAPVTRMVSVVDGIGSSVGANMESRMADGEFCEGDHLGAQRRVKSCISREGDHRRSWYALLDLIALLYRTKAATGTERDVRTWETAGGAWM